MKIDWSYVVCSSTRRINHFRLYKSSNIKLFFHYLGSVFLTALSIVFFKKLEFDLLHFQYLLHFPFNMVAMNHPPMTSQQAGATDGSHGLKILDVSH